MAVWLSLGISENYVNHSANTSDVTVTVTVHYNGGSYNGTNPSGTLTVDGVNYPFTCNFNYAGSGLGAATTGEGSVTAISQYIPGVAHNADGTKTLYCSASFNSGTTSSGTVYATGSKDLTRITVSGGDSGDSGGSGSSDESSTNIETHPDTNCTYLGTSHDNYTYGNNPMDGSLCYIKFKTPSDLISCESVQVVYDEPGGFKVYCGEDSTDETIVHTIRQASGSMTYMGNVQKTFGGDTIIEKWTEKISLTSQYSKSLEPDTEYYIMVAASYGGTFYRKDPPAIILNYTARGGIHVKSNGAEKKYLITAKTGDTVDMYEPYLKNGDSWDPIGNIPVTGDQYA